MWLWKKATGLLKDQGSVLAAVVSQRTQNRIPELETAIIRATSHDETRIDYKSVERVFKWIRASPVTLKPLLVAISSRIEKTSNWAVVLKCLMLIHGVFCCKTPAVLRIGRLPFDLSTFENGYGRSSMWGYSFFVRAYFTFLDNRGALLYAQTKKTMNGRAQELSRIQDWQALLDLLLLVKPKANNMKHELIFETMDCVVIEVFDLYNKICNILPRIIVMLSTSDSDGKVEAGLVMKTILKAKKQAKDLDMFFKFCKDFGVANAMDVPDHLPQLQDEDIEDLLQMINGANIEKDEKVQIEDMSEFQLKTIITDKWEVFHDTLDTLKSEKDITQFKPNYNPFEKCLSTNLPMLPQQDLPDLIIL